MEAFVKMTLENENASSILIEKTSKKWSIYNQKHSVVFYILHDKLVLDCWTDKTRNLKMWALTTCHGHFYYLLTLTSKLRVNQKVNH